MNHLDDFIKSMKQLVEHPSIDNLVDEDHGLPVISSSSSAYIAHADNEDMIEMLQTVEHAAPYFLFDDAGRIKPDVRMKLKKHDMEIVSVADTHHPFTHGVKTQKFYVLVSS